MRTSEITIVLMILNVTTLVAAPSEECEAAVVWEKMIDAKGGRKRLQSLSKFVVFREELWGLGRTPKSRATQVYSLPRWNWSYWMSRDRRLPAVVVRIDRNADSAESHFADGAPSRMFADANRHLAVELIGLFLETSDIRPLPTTCRITNHEVAVEAELGDLRFRFNVSPRTYLVDQMSVNIAAIGGDNQLVTFSRYGLESGLYLPKRRRRSGQNNPSSEILSYDFAPDINELLFERPLSVTLGQDQWRRDRVMH